MDPIELLIRLTKSWAWDLPPDRFRVAAMIIAMASTAAAAGEREIRLPVGALSMAARVSPKTIMRTLEDMVTAHVITIRAHAGRRDSTYVTLVDVSEVSSGMLSKVWGGLVQVIANESGSGAEKLSEVVSEVVSEVHPQPVEKPVKLTIAVQGFLHPSMDNPSTKSDSQIEAVRGCVRGSSADLDLLNPTENSDPSQISDLRSSTSRKGENIPNASAALVASHEPDGEQTDPIVRTKKPKVEPSKIPEMAWRYADRFRTRLLERWPTMALASRPWDGETKLRTGWADTFRLLHERDRRPWEEIAETIKWLFDHPESNFVVQSPDALREKWDRIAAARENERRGKPAKPGQDNRPAPEYKRWE